MDEAEQLIGALKRQLEQQQQSNQRWIQENQRYASLVNAMPFALWQRDDQLQLTFANQAFTELAEQAIDEGADELSLASIELFRGHGDLAQQAMSSGKRQEVEKHIVSKGQRRLWHIIEQPLPDGGCLGYGYDISEVDLAREEVQRHMSAQRDFLESTTSAMAVYGKDQRLKFYNFSFVAMWKLDESFLDSEPTYGEVLEKLREVRKLPEQSNFPQFKRQHTALFTELIDTHEEFFYLPDGKTVRVIALPHALGGLLFAYEDVTDRLALERSYNTLIAVQRETLDHLQEGVLVIGENGRVKLSNPTYARMWGIQEEQTHHEPHIRDILDLCRDLYPVENWEQYKSDFIGLIQLRRMQQGELERTNSTVLNWRTVPLPDGATLLTYSDITDSVLLERSLREKNEALEEADRLKTEFLANMSYELRSPLTSIMGFSDILSNAYFGELTEKQAEYIDGIQKSSLQLSYLINNILDLASIGAGYMQLDVSEIDIAKLLHTVSHLVRERMKLIDIDVQIECEEAIGFMQGDESRLRQVLFNLLNNAVKYSQAASEIHLSAKRLGTDRVILQVRDFGVGIAPDKQPHIFERFYRAGATRGQQSGSGLGLAIVKSFVELHGGHVEVESDPGQGALFRCILPRKQAS